MMSLTKHPSVHINIHPLYTGCKCLPHQSAAQFPRGSFGLRKMDFQNMFSSVFQFLKQNVEGDLETRTNDLTWDSALWFRVGLKDHFSASIRLYFVILMHYLMDNVLNSPSRSFFVFVMLSSRRWSLSLMASFLRSLAMNDLLSSSWCVQITDHTSVTMMVLVKI